MAESAAFSLASKILCTLASPAFDKGLSIWNARDELKKLQVTIETLQAVLLDAERKQRNSDAIKNWIKRLKAVLYEAEDLFDEVVTDDLLKKQMVEGQNKLSLKKKVRLYCSTSNPILSRNSIANKVKEIRKSLLEISTDMVQFGFVSGQRDEPVFGRRIGQDPGSFVDPKHVFGRDEDKKSVLDMLFKESNDAKPDAPSVIVVVGLAGMGKTTLAQLIYNDAEVAKNFSSRWFACISDTTDEMEVVGKIFQSICERNYIGFTLGQLQDQIMESVNDKKFFLVLDDVWDEGHSRWQHRMSLLGGGAKGSKIVVTTRSSEVAEALEAFETHTLSGLSEKDSWELFKSEAFTPEKKNDRRWEDLGREILKKCARVPLAIRSIGSLLRTKRTVGEWKSFKDKELSEIEEHCGQDSITMSVLKLSYDHLPSNIKHCFACCSLFPKDFVFDVSKLIYLWISQGYIQLDKEGNSFDEVGRSYFMNLLRRSFFQEAEEDYFGEIENCKMHDLVHDLAKYVAGEETVILNKSSSQYGNARHAHVCYEPHSDRETLPPVDSMNRLRSLVLSNKTWVVDEQFRSCKWLRALSLSGLGVEHVPSCIGELKLLRYLDLSSNKFKRLPDSVTNLLNLLALDLEGCRALEALPDNFRKLINLRYLNIKWCFELNHMPAGFGELSSLQYLSHFKIGGIEGDIETTREEKERIRSKRSRLDSLSGLQQIRGALSIEFANGVEEEDYGGDECWKLPVSPQALTIENYPGTRIPHWAATNDPSHLLYIKLDSCRKVKHLPPFRCLPYLRTLYIRGLNALEYIEEEEEGAVSVSLFFPSLKTLELCDLPELKGWSRTKNSHLLSFPLLSELLIGYCRDLKCMPSTPCIKLNLYEVDGVLIEHVLLSSSSSLQQIDITYCKGTISFPGASLTSLQECRIWGTNFSNNLHLASPHLQSLKVVNCSGVTSVEVEVPTPSLSDIEIRECSEVRSLRIAHPSALEQLRISDCPELVLGGVDWDSLPNLRLLKLDPLPNPEELPECLLRLQSGGQLEIKSPTPKFVVVEKDV